MESKTEVPMERGNSILVINNKSMHVFNIPQKLAFKGEKK